MTLKKKGAILVIVARRLLIKITKRMTKQQELINLNCNLNIQEIKELLASLEKKENFDKKDFLTTANIWLELQDIN